MEINCTIAIITTTKGTEYHWYYLHLVGYHTDFMLAKILGLFINVFSHALFLFKLVSYWMVELFSCSSFWVCILSMKVQSFHTSVCGDCRVPWSLPSFLWPKGLCFGTWVIINLHISVLKVFLNEDLNLRTLAFGVR